MAYDLKIVGGTVVDGSGSLPFRADIGIKDGRIVEIGALAAAAATTTVSAEGALVTPGFVDIHGHYDGQVSWDVNLAPSSQHGVTTAVMGSCGVGFAPCRAADRATLISLMEGVEDIPGSALAEGIRWRWERFGEYLDALDSQPHTIDFACQVPHDALRVWAMGARAVANEAATADDLVAMKTELRAALEAGAVGFSTGRTDNHRSASGAATPASEANSAELVALASAFSGLPYGVLQAVSDFDMTVGPENFDREFDVLEAMARAAGPHPTSISLMQRDAEPDQWQRILARAESANASGVPIRVQVAPRGIGVLLGLPCTFHPFIGKPSYQAIAGLPLAERVRAMRDPAVRARIVSEASRAVAGDGSAIPPLVDRLLAAIDQISFRMFRLGEEPDYEPPLSASIGARARGMGIPAAEALYDALLEGEGQELIYFPIFNYLGFNLDAVGAMMDHPLALPGLSDGGAHVGTICDASFPTFYLTHWARDRAAGRWPIERAVKFLTAAPARFMGFRDRGTLAPGMKADLNVIDHAALRLCRPRLVSDLPAGGQRLLQAAVGYRATVVSGIVVAENGEFTGLNPGRLVRGGR
ncbi:amidohydrolase [Deltaproteobacteria bacterium]|nr:amidohydrolase [Deltaproteobacteria bacterium]